MIYLDSAATTPIDPEVLETMIEYMKTQYGNPASKYYPQALEAQSALSEARKHVATLLNVEPENILFTSGASESNNFIIKGIAEKYRNKGKHIITSKIEHKSVLETCKFLETQGYEVTYLNVDSEGLFDLDQLEKSIRSDTVLVTLMWVNNEIGTINDINKACSITHAKGVLFHTDATQAVGKMPIDLNNTPVDFLSFSSHKIYGPKGVGAAYLGPDELGIRHKLPALIHGGSQEFKMRGGTHAMHDIVGFGKACEIAKRDMLIYIEEMKKFEVELLDKLHYANPKIKLNGSKSKKIPGLINLSIPGINNELFCKQNSTDFAISTGSACSINEKSYVLEELNNYEANYIRISINKFLLKHECLVDELYQLLISSYNN
ncbi:MAG: cysteine desulfurase DndA [Clostridiales bacterium 38-18]|nr:MAG: cysteine desulfurase DndA [Clostridiales bacterium 38-18]